MGPAERGAAIGVTATLVADLRRYLPRGADGPQHLALVPGSTVADLLDAIGIPRDAELTAGVDGELARLDTVLHDGADVILISPMEGG